MSTKIKWSDIALTAYKQMGEEMRGQGAHPIREINDPDNSTTLTMWGTPVGLGITQTFRDTGDVVYLRSVPGSVEVCAAPPAPTDDTPEGLLRRVQETQTAFWEAVHELEQVVGFDLDSTVDFAGCDVDDLDFARE